MTLSKLHAILLLLAAVACAAPLATADVVVLKNGERLEGVVASRENGYVVLRVQNGEIGLAEALVESVDSAAGPKSADLAAREEAWKKVQEEIQRERDLAARARRVAVEVAEASAVRERPAAAQPAPAAAEVDVRERLAQIDEIVSQYPTRREREAVRRRLLAHYFGGGRPFDTTLHLP